MVQVFHRLKWPVNNGVLLAYGKSNSGEVFQIASSPDLFKKSAVRITKEDDISGVIDSVYDTYFVFNDDYTYQLSVRDDVHEIKDIVEDVKELFGFMGEDIKVAKCTDAVKNEEFDDICKCLVTIVPGPSNTFIPVVWYGSGEILFTDNNLSEVSLGRVFSNLEDKYPSVDLDNEYDKRFVEIDIYNAKFVFNRNHNAYNGKVPNANLLMNVLAGIANHLTNSELTYAMDNVNEFMSNNGVYFTINVNDTEFEDKSVNVDTEKVDNFLKDSGIAKTIANAAVSARVDIEGNGPLPKLDKLFKSTNLK